MDQFNHSPVLLSFFCMYWIHNCGETMWQLAPYKGHALKMLEFVVYYSDIAVTEPSLNWIPFFNDDHYQQYVTPWQLATHITSRLQ